MEQGNRVTRLDPTNRLLAVIDDPAEADAMRRELAAAGVPMDGLEILASSAAAARLDPLGSGQGLWLRVKRIVGLMQADQSVDLALYAAALRGGRAVVTLRASADEREQAVAVLRAHGAHFVNFYGTLVTEEIIPWRGERPPLPDFLQR